MYLVAKKHSKWIGAKVKIKNKVGANFEVFDGYAAGKYIDIVKNKTILQTWRAIDDKWPTDHFSNVNFNFKSLGKNKCKITLTHSNVPAEIANNFKSGWKDYYWTPLKNISRMK
jgi:activator of HSP90 ATPase